MAKKKIPLPLNKTQLLSLVFLFTLLLTGTLLLEHLYRQNVPQQVLGTSSQK